jgi:drug/metabolite transporter (DMT)-like permease
LFARAFGLEALSPFKIVGAIVAFVGAAVIFSGQLRADVPAAHLIAVILAATCAALSGVALKLGPRQHPLSTNAAAAWVGFAVCLTASLIAREPHRLPVTRDALIPVLYLTVLGSVGAFSLYAWLVNHWKLTRISFIAVIVPVVALILGTIFRGERVSAMAMAGSALVFTGLGLGIAGDRARR